MFRTRALPLIRSASLRTFVSNQSPLSTPSASAPPIDAVAHKISSLLSNSSDWRHVICNSDLPGKLTPSLVSSVIRTSRNVDPVVLLDFFYHSAPHLTKYEEHQVDSFCVLALKLCNANLCQKARQLFEEMAAKYFPDGHAHALRCIRDIFSVERENFNVVLLDELIAAYSRQRFDDAPEVLLEMKYYNLAPTERCCNRLLADLFKANKLRLIWLVREFMIWAPDRCSLHSYCIFMKAYFKKGDPWSAQKLFYEMEKKGFKPNALIYNTMIFNLSKFGFIDEALHLKNQMLQNRLSLDSHTCSSLIIGLCRKKGAREARGLLDEMHQRDVRIDNIVYRSLMKGFMRENDSSQVLALKGEMEAKAMFGNAKFC